MELSAGALRCINGDLPRNKTAVEQRSGNLGKLSFLIATAETTLSFSSCSITSKSVVTSSAENGNTFSIWIRIISGNSAGSTLGRRNRWASTAATGRPRTKSSVAESNGTASPSVCNLRTFHEPFCRTARSRFRGDAAVDERRKFHPCAVGTMKMDGIPVSISELLPTHHLRAPTCGPSF